MYSFCVCVCVLQKFVSSRKSLVALSQRFVVLSETFTEASINREFHVPLYTKGL
uniref:Uncharacterized protein n=1 Tax=Anguilla anguilla TaxID=7936 RepID=A0A0E9WH27_ANGAN